MASPKVKNLVITGLSAEYHQTFIDMADLMELSRDQFLILLMAKQGVIQQGLKAVFPDQNAQEEWREVMILRLFELATQ